MADRTIKDSRQATAERNRDAIMDATVRLLEAGRRPTVSAVAKEAALSRVTVYSHFPEHRDLLSAVVERAVVRATDAIAAAEPDRDRAAVALRRVIGAGWEAIGANAALADAAAAELGHEAMRASHQPALDVVHRLIERGREDGSFRRDLEARLARQLLFLADPPGPSRGARRAAHRRARAAGARSHGRRSARGLSAARPVVRT